MRFLISTMNYGRKNWNDAIVIVKKQYNKENYHQMGEKFLTDYYNHYYPFDQGKVLGLETTEFVDLNDKYKFHVRIDRLNEAKGLTALMRQRTAFMKFMIIKQEVTFQNRQK